MTPPLPPSPVTLNRRIRERVRALRAAAIAKGRERMPIDDSDREAMKTILNVPFTFVAECRSGLGPCDCWRCKREAEKKLVAEGKAYWIKRPCDKHSARFELECPACNGKNSELVMHDPPKPDEDPPTEEFEYPGTPQPVPEETK